MSMAGLIACSLAFGSGFWINMSVALEEESGMPLLAMMCLIIAPFPMLVCCRAPAQDMPSELSDGDDDTRNGFRRCGLVIFGLLMTIAFGVLAIALRQYMLSARGFLLALFGACITGTVPFVMAKCALKGNRF